MGSCSGGEAERRLTAVEQQLQRLSNDVRMLEQKFGAWVEEHPHGGKVCAPKRTRDESAALLDCPQSDGLGGDLDACAPMRKHLRAADALASQLNTPALVIRRDATMCGGDIEPLQKGEYGKTPCEQTQRDVPEQWTLGSREKSMSLAVAKPPPPPWPVPRKLPAPESASAGAGTFCMVADPVKRHRCYDALYVPRTATMEDIRRAFKRQAL